ncbi:CLN3 protein-domain-containing protein [Endogone sp. FLAS-F59071]|nr:CLN3 protein-domain-containing protein [Endogone sp. FLAS-F59071]|eukprot:RUS21211.1 CLN3 protein-domain-containing protein [Endogone sp. FLAS-F59071]
MGIVLSRLRVVVSDGWSNLYAQVESTENPPASIKSSADLHPSTQLEQSHLCHHFISGRRPGRVFTQGHRAASKYSSFIDNQARGPILYIEDFIIAWSDSISYRLFGIVLASLSSGLGEMIFLMLTSRYRPDTIAAWSSGTGGLIEIQFQRQPTCYFRFSRSTSIGAGVLGSLAFLALTTWLELSVRASLILVSALPGLMAYTYFFLLTKPSSFTLPENISTLDEDVEDILAEDAITARPAVQVIDNDDIDAGEIDGRMLSNVPRHPEDMTFGEKLMLVRPLVMRFILPLFIVYWAEYTINQGQDPHPYFTEIPRLQYYIGVAPTLYFPLEQTPFHEMRDHYVTYQALYQLGVFISRSSVTILPIRQIWILSLLQVTVLVALVTQSVWGWIPNVYFVFLIILGEGLLGGAVYVNAFHRIRIEIPNPYKEFSLGVAGVADGAGITVAAVMSLWLEPALCCADAASVCCKITN